MKLYAWFYSGHGLDSFFIMSESKDRAMAELPYTKEFMEKHYEFYECGENEVLCD